MTEDLAGQSSAIITIKWNGVDISLSTHLCTGLTADVYKVVINDRSYAVKILKPGSSSAIKSYFLSEVTNLKMVWKEWFNQYPGLAHLTPEFLGADTEGESPFIIMELIEGKTIEEDIRTNGPYSENIALNLMSQFGKLLVCLHSHLNKVYSDIKFDNFWKLEELSAEGYPQLKITDWNVLNDLSEEGKHRDLFFSTLVFFRFLTGTALPYSRGQITVKLEDTDKFNYLSFGTKDFFYKALNVNINRRFHSAETWLEEIEQLNSSWKMSATDLNLSAARLLDDAIGQQNQREISKAAENFRKARIALDISGLKGRGNQSVFIELSQKIDKGFESTSHREKGLISLKGGQYREAIEIFDEGADRSVLEPTLLRRLYWLSRAANEIGFERFNIHTNEAIEAVLALVKGETLRAQHAFEEIETKISPVQSESLGFLIREAKILNLYNDAVRQRDMEKYEEAVKTLEAAYDLSKPLPSAPSTFWAEAIGDISPILQEAKIEANTLGVSNSAVDSAVNAFHNGDISQAGLNFLKSLSAAPENPKVVNQLKICVNKSLELGDWKGAGLLLEPAVGFNQIKNIFKDQLEQIHQLNFIEMLIKKDRYDESLNELIRYSTNHGGDKVALGNSYRKILMLFMENSLASDNLETSEKILQLATNTDLAWGKEFSEKLVTYQQQLHQRIEDVVPHLLLAIYDLHEQSTVEASKKATEFLTRLKAIIPPQDKRLESIREVESIVKNKLMDLTSLEDQEKDAIDRRVSEISGFCASTKNKIVEKEEKLKKLSNDDPVEREARLILVHEIARLASDGLKLTYDWKSIRSSSATAEQYSHFFKLVFEKIGHLSWKVLSEESRKHLSLIEQQKVEFEENLRNGNITDAEAILRAISPIYEGSEDLYQKSKTLDATKRLMAWAEGKKISYEENEIPPELIDRYLGIERDIEIIEELIRFEIPPLYWKLSGADTHLSSSISKLIKELRISNGKINSNLLSLVLNANQLSRKIQIIKEPSKKGELTGDTTEVYRVIKSVDEYLGSKKAGQVKKYNPLIREINKLKLSLNITPGLIDNGFNKLKRNQVLRKARQNKLKKIGLLGLLGLLVLGILFAGIEFVPKWIKSLTITPTVQILNTETPTVTPEPTPTPTIEATTTTEVSKYLYEASLEGIKDKAYIEKFLIDEAEIIINEMVEKIDAIDSGINGNMSYFNNLPSGETIFVNWSLDQGLQNSGLYELFIVDTRLHSFLNNQVLEIKVLANGEAAFPVVGGNSIIFKGSDTQSGDEWVSIGVYDLRENDKITITTELSGIELIPETVEFGIDAALIAKINQPGVTDFAFLQQLIETTIPIALADYSRAELIPAIDQWQIVESQGINSGGYRINMLSLSERPEIAIPFIIEPVGPGKYQLNTLISTELSTNIIFNILMDGAIVGTKQINYDAGLQGTLQTIGEINVPEGKHQILIKVSPENFTAGNEGVLALDAITLSIQKPPIDENIGVD